MSHSQQVYADYQGTCISPNARALDKLPLSFFTIRSRIRETASETVIAQATVIT